MRGTTNYKAELNFSLKDNPIEQTFYLEKDKCTIAKEAYILLSGRALYKTLTNKDSISNFAFIQMETETLSNKKVKMPYQIHKANYYINLEAELQKYQSLTSLTRKLKQC